MEKVAIVGSRHWKDWKAIRRLIDGLDDKVRVISGDAPGADAIALQYAKDCFPRITANKYRADWDQHGKAAGPIRNTGVASGCTWLVAFWDGRVEHSGTLDVFRKAVALEKPAILFWSREEKP